MRLLTTGMRSGLVALVLMVSVLGLTMARAVSHAGATSSTAGGLSVSVAYAEDKETITPDPASFPVPWTGAPNTTFLGASVPGQTACGTLTTCYDTGAIRLDNPGPTAITVNRVSVDDHTPLAGGKLFNNLWGTFTVAAGRSVILAANPPATNPGYDNFDSSGFPATCTPITVAPTVTITVGGVASTLVDSTHVLDSGGIDAGSCSPKHNESIQWRPIGAAGSSAATLTLGPTASTASAGQPATETATLLDGSGAGIPNATVNFTVTSGPDAGMTGTGVTNSGGQAAFTYTGTQGEDVVTAGVTSVGTFHSNAARIFWANHSSAGWTGADIGNPTPNGSQSFDPASGTWTVAAGGTGVGGSSDQFHYVWQNLSSGEGVAARVASLSATDPGAQAGVMVRASTDPGSAYYAAFATPGQEIVVQDRTIQGGATATVVTPAATIPTYLWVTDSGASLTTYSSPDGVIWTPIAGSTVNLSLGGGPLGGLAASSADPSALATTTLDSVAVSTGPPAPLPPVPCPAPWGCADIGSPALAGSQSFDPNSGTWIITAGGADITGLSDQFHFVWQTQSGNAAVSAHVTSQSNSSSNAKAGVMLRATTSPGSPYYAVLVSPGAGIKVQERSTQGGNTTKLANPTGTTPAYLQVTRSANTFTAATSVDGVTWTPIAGSSFTMSLAPTLLAGLAVTSHNAGQLSTVTMSAVTAS
jgi:Bacterial Ig-like domain (group 1)